MNKTNIAKFMTLRSVRYPVIVMLTLGVVAFYAAMALNFKFLSPIANSMKDFSMIDIYYQVLWTTTEPDTSRVVTIVDMTDQYYRSDIAKTIERIEQHNPRVLGIDALFDGDRDDLEANMMLMDAIGSHDNIVCSYVLNGYIDEKTGHSAEEASHAFFRDMMSVCEGFTNMPRELYGGIKREVLLGDLVGGKVEPSFALQVSNLYIDSKELQVPPSMKSVSINFSPKEFNVLKPDQIDRHPELIEGRVVLFGSMNEEGDKHYTPLGKMAGVKLLAYAVETILLQNEIYDVSGVLYVAISLILVFLIYMLELAFIDWTQRSRVPLVKYFLGSSYVAGLVVFLVSVVLMGIFFLVFCLTNVSVSLTLTLTCTAFLTASQSFYLAVVKTIAPDATFDKPNTDHKSSKHDKESNPDTQYLAGDPNDGVGTETDGVSHLG